MPLRPVNRDQAWLLPPTLDDLVPEDHPSRFVAAFVDGLDRIGWAGMEIDVDGAARTGALGHGWVCARK